MSKPWSQMSTDEKLDELKIKVERLLELADRNQRFHDQLSTGISHALAEIDDVRKEVKKLSEDKAKQ
jgi:hypothetical protein